VPAAGEEALVVGLEIGVLESVGAEDDVQDDAGDAVGRLATSSVTGPSSSSAARSTAATSRSSSERK
jgi:hypothetical protein